MINEFSKTEMLIGSQGIISLKAATVVIFGVGDVGPHATETLTRCGIGRLVLVDNNTISLTSVNRQSIAMHSTIGRPKTQVMREEIVDLSPDTRVITGGQFVLPQSLDTLFETIKSQMEPSDRVSYILGAISTMTTKLALISYAQENGVPIISSTGTGNELHPELLSISGTSQTSVCPLYRVMRKELKAKNISHLKVC